MRNENLEGFITRPNKTPYNISVIIPLSTPTVLPCRKLVRGIQEQKSLPPKHPYPEAPAPALVSPLPIITTLTVAVVTPAASKVTTEGKSASASPWQSPYG